MHARTRGFSPGPAGVPLPEPCRSCVERMPANGRRCRLPVCDQCGRQTDAPCFPARVNNNDHVPLPLAVGAAAGGLMGRMRPPAFPSHRPLARRRHGGSVTRHPDRKLSAVTGRIPVRLQACRSGLLWRWAVPPAAAAVRDGDEGGADDVRWAAVVSSGSRLKDDSGEIRVRVLVCLEVGWCQCHT
jgi:hypothetical protein